MMKTLFKIISRFDGHMLEILHGSTSAFIVKILAAGSMLTLNIILARLLGAEGVGVFFLVNTLIIIAATVGRFGFDNALIKIVAISVDNKKYENVLGVFRQATNYGFFGALVITITIYVMSPWISMSVFAKPTIETPLRIMSLSITPIVLLSLYAFGLQGLKRPAAHVAVLSLWVPLFTTILAFMLVADYGVVGASYSYLIAAILTLLVGMLLWKKSTVTYKQVAPCFERGDLFKVSTPLYLVTIMDLVITWTPLLLIAVWDSSANVGIFNAATRVAMLTSFVLSAVNSITAPKIAELFHKKDLQGLSKVAQNSTMLMILLSSPVLLLFILIPETVMALFGQEFVKGGNILVILAVGQFINAATGSVGYLLMMTGNERLMRNNMMFSALIMCFLSALLIPAYGVIGAAITYTVVVSIQNFIALYLVKKKLGILTVPFFVR